MDLRRALFAVREYAPLISLVRYRLFESEPQQLFTDIFMGDVARVKVEAHATFILNIQSSYLVYPFGQYRFAAVDRDHTGKLRLIPDSPRPLLIIGDLGVACSHACAAHIHDALRQ